MPRRSRCRCAGKAILRSAQFLNFGERPAISRAFLVVSSCFPCPGPIAMSFAPGWAQGDKPLRVILPVSAGSGVDTITPCHRAATHERSGRASGGDREPPWRRRHHRRIRTGQGAARRLHHWHGVQQPRHQVFLAADLRPPTILVKLKLSVRRDNIFGLFADCGPAVARRTLVEAPFAVLRPSS